VKLGIDADTIYGLTFCPNCIKARPRCSRITLYENRQRRRLLADESATSSCELLPAACTAPHKLHMPTSRQARSASYFVHW